MDGLTLTLPLTLPLPLTRQAVRQAVPIAPLLVPEGEAAEPVRPGTMKG